MAKIHNPSLRLASLYLLILMMISIFFSISLYQISVSELERGLRRPQTVLGRGQLAENLPAQMREQFEQDRLAAYESAESRIAARLFYINIVILVGGGLLSYYLALRTLRPIEEAHEQQRRFTADASHELRTPITAMKSENEVALMDPKLSLKQAKAQIQSTIEELDKLILLSEGLLSLAKTEDSAPTLTKQDARDAALLAVQKMTAAAAQRNINFVTDASTVHMVYADTQVLSEAIVILIDNAIKYSDENSTIYIDIAAQQNNVVISVRDTGIGMNAYDVEHVFDRFYRADNARTKQSTGGYGLGLSIAKQNIDMLKGIIVVKSKLGAGTTFTIQLPAA